MLNIEPQLYISNPKKKLKIEYFNLSSYKTPGKHEMVELFKKWESVSKIEGDFPYQLYPCQICKVD